jgi:hypothetical protein
MFVASLVFFVLALRALYLHAWLQGSVPIRHERRGLLGVEVRRRVGMERVPSHFSEFPVPREERIRVVHCLGLVLWHSEVSVALPNAACECFANVAPQDFDREFPSWLRLSTNPA